MKVIFILFELAAALAAGVLVVTQIIFPVANGRPLFPFFRRRNRVLIDQLEEAYQRADERALKEEIKAVKSNRGLELS